MLIFRRPETLDEFAKREEEIVRRAEQLPADWLTHENLVKGLYRLENAAVKALRHHEKSLRGEFERRVSDRVDRLFRRIEKHNTEMQRSTKNHDLASVQANLQRIADDVHQLHLFIQGFHLDLLPKKDVRALLDEMRSGVLKPPDIDQATAAKILERFSTDKLIVALQYEYRFALSRPYLFVALSAGRVQRHVIKHQDAEYADQLFVSKLMGLLNIPRINIDENTMVIDDAKHNVCHLSYMEGKPITHLPPFRDRKGSLAFAYLLGAATADGFVTGLSDRKLSHIFLDTKRWKEARRHPGHHLGIHNPIFHIDYGVFHSQADAFITRFVTDEVHGTFMSLFRLCMEARRSELTFRFNDGFRDEMRRLVHAYNMHRSEVHELLERYGHASLAERFNLAWVRTLKRHEAA